jgi:hypothetical protein
MCPARPSRRATNLARSARRSSRRACSTSPITQILHVTAASDTAEALLAKLAEALLDLFPQAEDVGVLVEDERTGELRVQCQRHRARNADSGAHAADRRRRRARRGSG